MVTAIKLREEEGDLGGVRWVKHSSPGMPLSAKILKDSIIVDGGLRRSFKKIKSRVALDNFTGRIEVL